MRIRGLKIWHFIALIAALAPVLLILRQRQGTSILLDATLRTFLVYTGACLLTGSGIMGRFWGDLPPSWPRILDVPLFAFRLSLVLLACALIYLGFMTSLIVVTRACPF